MADVNIDVKVVTTSAIAAMNSLNTTLKSAQISLDKSTESTKGFNTGLAGTTAAGVAAGNVISKIVVTAFNALSDSVKFLISGGLDLEAQIQNLTFKFQALLPVTKDAKNFLEEIGELSDKSPFEFPELAEAAQKLLVFGVNSEKVIGVLSTLGDISAASGANIEQLALAFGKATESGFITGRELNEFRNNGIPVIQALAKELDISAGSVKKLANEGKIDIKSFEQALVSLTNEGGFAFDAMNKKALTLDGSQKKLHDSVEGLQKLFGENLAPVVILVKNNISALIQQFTAFLKETDALDIAVKSSIIGFELLVDVGVILYNSFQALRFITTEVVAGFAFVGAGLLDNIIAPIELAIRALATLGSSFGINTDALTKAADGIGQFRDEINKVPSDIHASAEQIGTDMAKTQQGAEDFKLGIENAYISLSTNLRTAAKGTKAAGEEIETGLTEAQKEEQRKRLENQLKFQEDILKIQNNSKVAIFESQLIADGEFDIQEQIRLEKLKASLNIRELEEQASHQRRLGNTQAAALLEQSIETKRAQTNLGIQKLLNQQKKEEEQRDLKNQQDFFSAAISLSNSENKTLLTIGRAAALAQLAIKAPEAIGNSFAFGTKLGGPPLGFAFGAIAAAAMAAQAAQIVGLKFANGGVVPGTSFTGDRVSANVNSGEMILNRQQQATLFDIANRGDGSGLTENVTHITVELDGEVVARSVSRQVANGLKLGEVA